MQGTGHRGQGPDGGGLGVDAGRRPGEVHGEEGYLLVAVVVMVFLVLLVLSVAAPKVALELRREREEEAVHRANQYVRAIRLFYLKNGNRYPGSLEQLEKTNNIRFLRQKYVDPMTGKADWRLIHLGEAKTTVKGFFGQPLAGLPTGGLGSASGMASPGGTGAAAGGLSSGGASGSAFGGSGSGAGSAFGGSSAGAGSAFGGGAGQAGGAGAAGGSAFGAASASAGVSSQSATSATGQGGFFVGISSAKEGESIVVVNEQTTYQTWEFLYDPRIEQLKAKASLFGGGPTSTNSSSLGSAAGSVSGGQGAAGAGAGTGAGTTPDGLGTSGKP